MPTSPRPSGLLRSSGCHLLDLLTFDLVAVFELDADDRIPAWREYFDSASVAQSMGIEPAQMAQ